MYVIVHVLCNALQLLQMPFSERPADCMAVQALCMHGLTCLCSQRTTFLLHMYLPGMGVTYVSRSRARIAMLGKVPLRLGHLMVLMPNCVDCRGLVDGAIPAVS